MPHRAFVAACLLTALAATAPTDAPARYAEALRLARSALLADTHIDAPYRLDEEGWRDLSRAVPDRDFDYEKARAGGLDLAFMSIYTPSELDGSGKSKALADRLIDSVEALVGRAPERFALVRSPDEAEAARTAGKIGLALGMENGAPIEGKLENLRHFHDRGIRYITLAHALSNDIADASFDRKRRWHGLSPFGREVVTEMNRLGIMVDVSHLSDEAIRDVLASSRVPVIASHSSARHFTPGFERNLSDELAQAIAAKGGVVQLNFGTAFLTAEANGWFVRLRAEREAWQARQEKAGQAPDSAAVAAWTEAYVKAHPAPAVPLAAVADHVDHLVKLIGVDHVGFGSDFDGVGDSLPVGLRTVADYPNLLAELLRRGYGEDDLRKLMGGNLLRAWRAVEQGATVGAA